MPSSMPSTSEGKKRMYRYLGDFEEEDMNCPTKAKQALLIAKRQVASQRRKIDQTSNTRCKKKVSSLGTLLSELKEKTNLSDEVCQVLEASLPGPSKDLVKRALSAQEKGQYLPELRYFALTLQFYTTKAYNYVRETFDFALPHESTLRKWYNAVDGSAGFTSGALTALKTKVAEASQKGEKVYCAMVVDEVAIRQHVEWDWQELSGYVDFGTGVDSDQLPVAKDAWVFLLTCVNL